MDIITLIIIALFIGGVHNSSIEHTVMDKDCGTLTIIQPVVYGRSVNFTFRPKRPVTAPSVSFIKSTTRMETLSSNMTADKGEYTYTLQSLSRSQERYFFRYSLTTVLQNRPKYCDSNVVSLTELIRELTGSGLLYMYKRSSIKVGDTVELRYMPSDDVINSKTCSRGWMLRRNDNENLEPVAIDDQGIIEQSLSFNHEYVLVIRDIDQSLSGNISVHCGGLKSNEVSICAAVKPSQPRFRSPSEPDFEDCVGCLYGNVGEELQLICEARGGTQPVEANITISGLKMKIDDRRGDGVFTSNHTLLARDHLQNVSCDIKNPAVDPDRPLVTSRRLFVIKEPGLTTVSGFIVKEGHPVNITCVSRQARPPPELDFVINNRSLKINALTKLRQDKLYDSIGTLNSVERQWNNQTVKCCARHALYRQDKCSEAARIHYAFGPSEVMLVAKQQLSPSTSVYVYDLVCHVTNSNPLCDITIEGIQFLNKTEDKQFVDGGWSVSQTVTIQVTDADLGRSVRCVADCTSLEKKYYSSFMKVPPEESQETKGSSTTLIVVVAVAVVVVVVLVVVVLTCAFSRTRKVKEDKASMDMRRPPAAGQGDECPYDLPNNSQGIRDPSTSTSGTHTVNVSTHNDNGDVNAEYAVVIPKSQRTNQIREVSLPEDESCEYAVVKKDKKIKAPSVDTSNQKMDNSEELNYAELELSAYTPESLKPTQGQADGSGTEYTSIDFAKTVRN